MKKQLTLLFGFVCLLVQAQTTVHLKDKNSNTPIAYANVWKGGSLYITADSTGVFTVQAKDTTAYFKISCIGYHDTIAKVSSTMFLNPDKIVLEEVKVVKRKFDKEVKLGKVKRGDNHYAVQWDTKIAMTAKYFPNKFGDGKYLSKVRFFAMTTAKNRLISIMVYSVGQDGKPYKVVNAENLMYKLKKGTHVVEADLNSLNIEFPTNGIYIVIQHPLLEQNKNYCKECHHPDAFFYEPMISFDDCSGCKDFWYFNDGTWQQSDNRSLDVELRLTD